MATETPILDGLKKDIEKYGRQNSTIFVGSDLEKELDQFLQDPEYDFPTDTFEEFVEQEDFLIGCPYVYPADESRVEEQQDVHVVMSLRIDGKPITTASTQIFRLPKAQVEQITKGDVTISGNGLTNITIDVATHG